MRERRRGAFLNDGRSAWLVALRATTLTITYAVARVRAVVKIYSIGLCWAPVEFDERPDHHVKCPVLFAVVRPLKNGSRLGIIISRVS